MFKRLLIAATLLLSLTLPHEVDAQAIIKLWNLIQDGSITANAASVVLPDSRGLASVGLQVTGTFTGTIALQCSLDLTNWTAILMTPTDTATGVTEVTAPGIWVASVAGCRSVRARSTAWTSGTAVITIYGSSTGGAPPISLGNLTFGDVTVNTTALEGKVDTSNSSLAAIAGFFALSHRSDTFTAVGDGTTVDVSTYGRKWFGVQVKGTGAAATSWTVNLQTSVDGTNWNNTLIHTSAARSDGQMIWISTPAPSRYFRANVEALTLGSATNIVVYIIGTN